MRNPQFYVSGKRHMHSSINSHEADLLSKSIRKRLRFLAASSSVKILTYIDFTIDTFTDTRGMVKDRCVVENCLWLDVVKLADAGFLLHDNSSDMILTNVSFLTH